MLRSLAPESWLGRRRVGKHGAEMLNMGHIRMYRGLQEKSMY